ncbi:hypothetical protein BT67DRAFT_158261 [Trichocladium antarcticum]|uniref:Uncharacterized protein n=1 Tax=Trichocladium antarcticum TaxID=1450529 RepID=A0AAN6UE52_9PEZI|nr:hypothetical protein BT67DRAFT_158261 [Trichocladium antarcticum]
MYGHFPYLRVGPAAREDSCGQAQLPPGGNASEGEQTPVPKFEVEDGLRQDHQHHQQKQHNASFTPPTTTPPPGPPGQSSPGRAFEGSAHRLSRHNLQQLNRASHAQLPTQPTRLSRSSPPGLPGLTESPVFLPLTEPGADDQSHRYIAPWLPVWLQDINESIEIDEEYLRKPDDAALDAEQSRQANGPLRSGLPSTRAADPRVEAMVASGTQCNVRAARELRPTPTPSQPTPGSGPSAHPAVMEADPDWAMPMSDLEAAADDDDDGEAGLDAMRDWTAPAGRAISLRHASGPGGIRKYSVGTVALRYQLSSDAAMRCANVVRSRPRMRRRRKTRHGSGPSSAVTSPVVSPAARSPVLPPHFLPP